MKKVALISVVLLTTTLAWAQFNPSTRKKQSGGSSESIMDKLYFAGGGGFGAGTGAYGRYNYFSVLPTVGYKVTPEFLLGMNFTYSKYSYPDYGISYDQIGFAPFARYYFQQLFFQIEYNKISSLKFDQNGLSTSRRYYDRFLVGLGYKTPIGKRSAINALGLYDVLYKQSDGVFTSPFVFRVFVSF